ncbi:S8 family serine peptidase [Cellulomonas soli]|uniref:Peptidase S8/S53 domain-containing protein n=1 Tax=Cellulomonas soli TaxID=931535 RepID=A0A512P9A6_9CELL|nr:S8 family serine peptidase [Cellulomonas soli]NYI57997.1 type VII secretion-associated serine protease mycosin [Cellulomonas soli]GEP67781.1 hypothetical protein CSO01_04960 [Cellulomonas soli]
MSTPVPRPGRRAGVALLVGALAVLSGPTLGAAPASASGGTTGAATGATTAATAAATSDTATAECTVDEAQYSTVAPTALALLSADTAWRWATGAGVVVAVVDSGVDSSNAHLTGSVVAGIDLVAPGTTDGTGRTDVSGHGTAVAGLIAARQVDGSALVGLAPGATILPVRVFVAEDDAARAAGTAPDPARIAAGIEWAVAAGATIINVSMSTTIDDPRLRAAVSAAAAAGALVVASAGNRTTSDDTTDGPRYPAAYPEALAVTAVDAAGAATDDAIHGEHVDIAAPGTDVLTTYHGAGDCLLDGTEVSTSFATGYVSAAAALVAERYPQETPEQWRFRLMSSASRVAPDTRDDLVGWGVVRPEMALALVDDGTLPGPVSPVHPRPTVSPEAGALVDGSVVPSPLAAVRAPAAAWGAGAAAAVVLALLGSRLVGRTRRRRGARSAPAR